MFNDFDFCDEVGFVGVNLINWGCVLVQVVYYFLFVVLLGVLYCKVFFIVLIGNFGDIFVGFIVKQMGLLIDWLVIVMNQNDILYCCMVQNDYMKKGVKLLILLLMDIEVLLNFEWVLFWVYDKDGVVVLVLMDELKIIGIFSVLDNVMVVLCEYYDSGSIDEVVIFVKIILVFVDIGELLCLYSVVGVDVVECYFGMVFMVILVIVYFVKFLDVVEKVSGICLFFL